MLKKVVLDALNDQIKHELYSAYLYLSMSTYCEEANLPGFAHWLRQQSSEELSHAMKIREHVEDRGSRVLLQAIEQPPTEFSSLQRLFEQVLEHERKVTSLIHNLHELARKENDVATEIFLQWFVNEQVEEEKSASDILEELRMIGDAPSPLLMLDRHLATRQD